MRDDPKKIRSGQEQDSHTDHERTQQAGECEARTSHAGTEFRDQARLGHTHLNRLISNVAIQCLRAPQDQGSFPVGWRPMPTAATSGAEPTPAGPSQSLHSIN